MRAPKFAIAIVLLTPILMLAVFVSARAQIGFPSGAPPAPLAPPPPPPGAPSVLATPAVVPPLAPAPTVAAVGAGSSLISSTPRPFACSCSGPGFNTHWVGNVVAPNPIIAREEASGSCIAFNSNDHAQSPFIAPPQFQAAPIPSTQTSAATGSVVNPGAGLLPQPGSTQPLVVSRLTIAAACSRCACD
jgi:hypothetical protein